LTRQRFFQVLRKAAKDKGLTRVGAKPMHPHVLRHSHCVAYVRRNNTLESLRKLQLRLGQANINTTRHYLSFNPEDAKVIEEVFGKA
jgi:site-specific recombinase XerD